MASSIRETAAGAEQQGQLRGLPPPPGCGPRPRARGLTASPPSASPGPLPTGGTLLGAHHSRIPCGRCRWTV